jgi:MFS superfamily sulfate permease-like transporter
MMQESPPNELADKVNSEEKELSLHLFDGLRPITRAGVFRDAMAGVALAAMNIPQALGYTRIAGTPVVTGLYTLLLPLVAFASFGSSRYLVVAADSATAAILAGSLTKMAPVGSPHYVALAGMVALLSGVFLLVARIFEFGFLADFLSQTVLVGFLTGVGLQVGIAMLGEMLGVPVTSDRTVEQLAQTVRGLPHLSAPTFLLAVAVVVAIPVLRKTAPRFPGALLIVVAAIIASAAFDFSGHGIAIIEWVEGGLPSIRLPEVSLAEFRTLVRVAASCFLMIVAQSAATARAYASRHHQALDENSDLIGLSAANVAAALTGTFVVNGSPTQTAMVESSGGRSQFAHLATSAVVAIVLLLFTGPLHYLPRCVLAAIVFTIALRLIDLKGLLEIRKESPGEFQLALITAATVVVVGVEDGILLAIALSLLRHVRHSYRPHCAVLVKDGEHWLPTPAIPGSQSAPGLVIFQFGADLFYANVGSFALRVRGLVDGAPTPVTHLVVDAGAIISIDYSAARVVHELQEELIRRRVALVLVHPTQSLVADLNRHRLSEVIGIDHIFETLRDALSAIEAGRVHVVVLDTPREKLK